MMLQIGWRDGCASSGQCSRARCLREPERIWNVRKLAVGKIRSILFTIPFARGYCFSDWVRHPGLGGLRSITPRVFLPLRYAQSVRELSLIAQV